VQNLNALRALEEGDVAGARRILKSQRDFLAALPRISVN